MLYKKMASLFIITFLCIISFVYDVKGQDNNRQKSSTLLESNNNSLDSNMLASGKQSVDNGKPATNNAYPPAPASSDKISGPQGFTKTDTEQAGPTDRSTFSLFDLFRKGGPFMWPILLFAAISMGFIIERFIFFRRANLNPREFISDLEERIFNDTIEGIKKFCASHDYIISKIIIKGLKLKDLGYERVEKGLTVAGSVEVAGLERGLNILSSLGNIAPMIGFLGTVSGMISAFSRIASADQVNARLVAGGIEEALLTTAAGLIVAIPTLFFYNYFVHRIEVFIADVEKLSSGIIEKMIEEGHDENQKID